MSLCGECTREVVACVTAHYPNTKVHYHRGPAPYTGLSVNRRRTQRLDQPQAFLRARHYSAPEWDRVPQTHISHNRHKHRMTARWGSKIFTHLTMLSSSKLTPSFSSTGASISNRRRMQAILRKSVRAAKYRPGQILRGKPHHDFNTMHSKSNRGQSTSTFCQTRISSLRDP